MEKNSRPATALVANESGDIFELEGYAAVGMAGDSLAPLTSGNAIAMPSGGELMRLPDRAPLLYNRKQGRFETLCENPHRPGETIYPVAAFNSPGYVASLASAFQETEVAQCLPLFSYAAVGWLNGFKTAALLIDSEPRQNLKFMRPENVWRGIKAMRKKMPKNRLRKHLETCAATYGCPAGKNFFLRRYEAPLPSSRVCNARCLGCISLQASDQIASSQNRISFTPSPEEIAEVALEHIKGVPCAVVSFGQGCEGDPLMVWETLESAIRIIRSKTRMGTIHMNTNGSRPDQAGKLFDAGLDSMRVSMNSAVEAWYNAWFRPVNYTFSDVKKSVGIGLSKKKFVSINYLNCPGLTDTPQERRALHDFIKRLPIQMIQWRNLNFDPKRYLDAMRDAWEPENPDAAKPEGIKTIIAGIRAHFPKVMHGYFNPPKEKFNTQHSTRRHHE